MSIIIVIIAIIIILMIGLFYNNLIKTRNIVENAESGIDVYLKQRFDLIPNLVECIKGYSKHEEKIFTEIANLRSLYMNDKKSIENAELLNNKMNQLIAIAENYPELKADTQYLNLQKTLAKIESQLQAARRLYNMEVTKYNTKIEVFPLNIIANLFGFKRKKLFEIEDSNKENIEISFN